MKQNVVLTRASILGVLLAFPACGHATLQQFTPGPLATAHSAALQVVARRSPAIEDSILLDDSGAQRIAALSTNSPVRIMNGSMIHVIFHAAAADAVVRLHAGDSIVTLTHSANLQWEGVLRYVDSLNPPPPHPALDFIISSGGKQTVAAFPIIVLHQ